MVEDVTLDRAKVARIRAKAERETRQLVKLRETEYRPLWERILGRKVENSFGREYTLSLTPRGR